MARHFHRAVGAGLIKSNHLQRHTSSVVSMDSSDGGHATRNRDGQKYKERYGSWLHVQKQNWQPPEQPEQQWYQPEQLIHHHEQPSRRPYECQSSLPRSNRSSDLTTSLSSNKYKLVHQMINIFCNNLDNVICVITSIDNAIENHENTNKTDPSSDKFYYYVEHIVEIYIGLTPEQREETAYYIIQLYEIFNEQSE